MTTEIAFSKKFETSQEIAKQAGLLTVRNPAEFSVAEQTLKTIRELEKELDAEYKGHPVIIEAKRLQGLKGDLATLLENARKGLKGGAMLRYEQAEEAKRAAEETRLQKEAQARADAEAEAQVAEQRRQWEIAEKARKAAQNKGDEEAMALAAAAAELARQTAAQIKADAAVAVVPTVVVEKTAPSVSRRTIPKFRYLNATGKEISEQEANFLNLVPPQYRTIDPVKIGGVIRSLRGNHGICGVEYYEVTA